MYDSVKAKKATDYDHKLHSIANPIQSGILTYVGKKWRAKKVFHYGLVITDPVLINEYIDQMKPISLSKAYLQNTQNGDSGAGCIEYLISMYNNPSFDTLIRDYFSKALNSKEFTQELSLRYSLDQNISVVDDVLDDWISLMWKVSGLESITSDAVSEKSKRVLKTVLLSKEWNGFSGSVHDVRVNEAALSFIDQILGFDLKTHTPGKDTVLSKVQGNVENSGLSFLMKDLLLNITSSARVFIPRILRLLLESGLSFKELADYDSTAFERTILNAFNVINPVSNVVISSTEHMDLAGKVSVEKDDKVLLSTVVGLQRMNTCFDPTASLPPEVDSMWEHSRVLKLVLIPCVTAYIRKISSLLAATGNSYEVYLSIPSKGRTHGELKEFVLTKK